jgi:hypothetical protein
MSARDILADIILDESGNSPNGIADRILADKRIAVAELPEATRIDDHGWTDWHVDTDSGEASVDYCAAGVEGFPDYCIRFMGRWATANDITKIAAALLAAANAAEATK